MRPILMIVAALAVGGATPAFAVDLPSDSAVRGLFIAVSVCAACHTVGTLGTEPDREAPPFATIWPRHDKQSLRRRLREISSSGHRAMPAIPLTPRQIEDVANYIEAIVPEGPPHYRSISAKAAPRPAAGSMKISLSGVGTALPGDHEGAP
jgi:mono/diheme cytochrome c family protein